MEQVVFLYTALKVVVKLLVHPEVIANKIRFGGLSPKILFYKIVKVLKPFMI